MNELLILLDAQGRKHAVSIGEGMVQVPNLGTFDSGKLRTSIGRRITVGGKTFLVLRASRRDFSETMQRGPQVLASKDIASILYNAEIEPGARVVEAGSGSGALTVALARAVGPTGVVVSYDLRADLQTVARANVIATGLEAIVVFRVGDIRKEIPERDIDSILMDIPDPWSAVPACWASLKPGGSLASFSPNMEQVKEMVVAMKQRPFVEVRTIELIEREMEVREVGVRPSFAPLGHTGYLTFARKALETL